MIAVYFICKLKLKSLLLTLIVICLIFILISYIYLQDEETIKLPILIWWTPFTGEYQKVINCMKKCIITSDRRRYNEHQVNAVLFYGSDIQIDDLPLPRNNAIPWAIYHEESPKNLPFFNTLAGQRLFNITSTFSRLSNLPLMFQYLEDINFLTDRKYFKSLEFKNSLLMHLAPILYIQKDCDTPINRDSYVKELMKYIKIDSYGDCLNNQKLEEKFQIKNSYDLYNEEFMHFVSQYKFVISIENSVCHDYITEKLWRPLIVGSIPIYLGSPAVKDWLPQEKSAILIQNFQSPKDVANVINLLNENDSLYNEYLDHKYLGKVVNPNLLSYFRTGSYGTNKKYDSTIEAFECYVCDNYKKDSIVTKSVYDCLEPGKNNSWSYQWKMGKCQAKVLNNLINQMKVSNISQTVYNKLALEYFQNDHCD